MDRHTGWSETGRERVHLCTFLRSFSAASISALMVLSNLFSSFSLLFLAERGRGRETETETETERQGGREREREMTV